MTPTTESSIDLDFKQEFEKWPKNLERQKPLRVPEIVPGTFHTKIWNGTCMLFNVCGHFWHYYLGTVDPEGCTSRAPIWAGTFHVVPLGGISGTISLFFERVFEKKEAGCPAPGGANDAQHKSYSNYPPRAEHALASRGPIGRDVHPARTGTGTTSLWTSTAGSRTSLSTTATSRSWST